MKVPALCLGVLFTLGASPTAVLAQQIRLDIRDGRATLDVTDATPAEILAEWARVGGTRIVDGERVPGAPLTLKLEAVPERQALEIILRGAAGYIAAARPAGAPGASAFDRIVVMPVSVNAAAARTGPMPMNTPMAPSLQQMAEPMPMTDPVADQGQDGTAEVPMVDDGVGAEQPVSSTDFDYANPQRYFAARAAQQRVVAAPTQSDDESGAVVGTSGATGPGGFTTGTLLSTPGTIPVPETAPRPGMPTSGPPSANPYGLPADAAPGSSPSASPLVPDRSKYINPYAPTPTRPPDQ